MIAIKNRFTGEVILRIESLRGADLKRADLKRADLQGANLKEADLKEADLDFSCLDLSCKSLVAIFDQKHIVQILTHAAIPCERNRLKLDTDVQDLLKSDLFVKVVQKFHRSDVEKYKGNLK